MVIRHEIPDSSRISTGKFLSCEAGPAVQEEKEEGP